MDCLAAPTESLSSNEFVLFLFQGFMIDDYYKKISNNKYTIKKNVKILKEKAILSIQILKDKKKKIAHYWTKQKFLNN